MRISNLLLLAALGFSLVSCASAQTDKRRTNENNKAKNTKPMNEKPKAEPTGESIKILAEGFYESLDAPFIFAARSAETYAQLQKIAAQKLPPASEIDFAKSAVLAAFAGTKNTGGYSVSVVKTGGKLTVGLIEPPKDAMTTDALTTPFAIALVSIEAEETLPIEVSENWKKAMRTYRVVSGKFETSGGIAGQRQRFDAEGAIGVLRFGDYATLFFDLSEKGADASGRRLTEAASGWIKNGKIELARLDAGSFSSGPKPPLKVSGMLSDDKISLTFKPLPAVAADGFQTSGKLEAVKIER